MTLEYTLPWPPSINGYWRAFVQGKSVRQILSKRGREFRDTAVDSIKEQGVHLFTEGVRVVIRLYPPTKRKFDVDNYGKAILDALDHAGVFEDDSQVVELRLIKCEKTKGGRSEVTIEGN